MYNLCILYSTCIYSMYCIVFNCYFLRLDPVPGLDPDLREYEQQVKVLLLHIRTRYQQRTYEWQALAPLVPLGDTWDRIYRAGMQSRTHEDWSNYNGILKCPSVYIHVYVDTCTMPAYTAWLACVQICIIDITNVLEWYHRILWVQQLHMCIYMMY